jgi:chemotaxis protein MotB
MFKYRKYVKLLALPVFIGMSGCAELTELRNLNRRQAITIRDQSEELSNLRRQVNALSHKLKASEEEMGKLRKLAEFIGEGVTIRDTLEGPVILFPERILFDSGMAKIKPKGEGALKKIAGFLEENPSISLRIDGHTDTDPIVKTKHLWNSNHHLAAARALSVFHFLTKNEHITEGRVHVAGFGPNRPITENHTSAGKRENRRVEFLVLSTVTSLPPKGEDLSF